MEIIDVKTKTSMKLIDHSIKVNCHSLFYETKWIMIWENDFGEVVEEPQFIFPLPDGATLSVTGSDPTTGGGTVTIGTTAGSTGDLICDGATLSGQIDTKLCVCPPTDGVATVKNSCTLKNVTLRGEVLCGPSGTSIKVASGGTTDAQGAITIDPSVVVDGILKISTGTVNGNTTIKTGGTLVVSKDVIAPYIKNFDACENGAIVAIYIADRTCADIKSGGASGTLFTSSTVKTDLFKCRVEVRGKDPDCKIDLIVVKRTTGARRLLGTTTADCGTASVGNGGATYNVCPQQSAASHSSLSYIALFVTLFIALFFQ